jgi:probable HAF family extracellular repeat protein
MRIPILRFATIVTCLVLCSPYQVQANSFTFTSGTFTDIAVPGANFTSAVGINDAGHIVGTSGDATGTHGFLDSGGSFTPIDVPGATETFARGINDTGQIVGTYNHATDPPHGFLDSGGSFTPIDVPGATQTDAEGINTGGQIVGFYAPPIQAVPEPSSLLLLGCGLLGLAAWRWKHAS